MNYIVGDHPQDEFITIQASKKDKHTDRKGQEENEDGDRLNYRDEEIREMDRRLTQMRQQGFYPIDASIKVIESEDTEKRGISQRRPSFLTDSFEEVKENTQLKSQTFLDQKPFRQRLENPPPVGEDNYTENTQVPGFNVAYAKSTVRHRIDFLNVRNAKNVSTLHAQTLVTTNS